MLLAALKTCKTYSLKISFLLMFFVKNFTNPFLNEIKSNNSRFFCFHLNNCVSGSM